MKLSSLASVFVLQMALSAFAYAPPSFAEGRCIPSTTTQDEIQRQCTKAYKRLLEKRKVNEDEKNEPDHFLSNRSVYLSFDTACLCSFSQSTKNTQEFLKKYLVSIFALDGKVWTPYCTGFRISKRLVVTAKHCLDDIRSKSLSFLSSPVDLYQFDFLDDPTFGDLNDYQVLKVEGNLPQFLGSIDDFSSEVPTGQALNVFAISQPAYVINGATRESWVDYVRYSKVKSAQAFDHQNLKILPDDKAISARCLYYGMQTYAGMSGAPILKLNFKAPNLSTLKIVGIHLRDGAEEGVCGSDKSVNIGIRLPSPILEAIQQGEQDDQSH